MFLIFALLSTSFSALCDIGIRAGIGSYFASDTLFKGIYANAYMAELRVHLNDITFATGGIKITRCHNKSVPIAMLQPTGENLSIGSYKHRVDALFAGVGIGAGKLLGEGKMGIYLYGQVSSGILSPLISQQIEYYKDDDTTTMFASIDRDRNWAFVLNPAVGVEGRVLGIGIFLELDYLWGNSVNYDPVELENKRVFSGGKISPSGWMIFAGIVID